MASGREIKTKIKSVHNTRKVTSALQMVSASKIRKAQELMRASRPYARAMRQLIAHIAHARSEYKHPYLIERDNVKRVGYIVVSTDRGLCGGLNINLFRRLLSECREHRANGVEVDFVVVGQKGVQFFRHVKDINLLGSATHLGERPKLERLVGIIKVMLDAYKDGTVDRVTLCYNDFVSTMTQQARMDALLPLPAVAAEVEAQARDASSDVPQTALAGAHEFAWDYLYEPSAASVLEHVLQRYIESLVYQAVLENLASEQAARMIAMKNATDNAGKLIDELTLMYNKARQAAITQEISEIVSGAAAV